MLGAPDGWSFRSTPCPSSVAHACRVLAGHQLRRTATLAARDDPLAQRVFIIDIDLDILFAPVHGTWRRASFQLHLFRDAGEVERRIGGAHPGLR